MPDSPLWAGDTHNRTIKRFRESQSSFSLRREWESHRSGVRRAFENGDSESLGI